MKQLEPHPFCLIFPEMDNDELYALADDLSTTKQRVPIVLYKDKILDGRSRFNALTKLGITPWTCQFQGTPREALQHAISLNLHRRHMNASQKAIVAANIKRALVECGVPAKKAQATAEEKTGASPRYTETAERIIEESPKLAQRIASGKETIGGHERKQAAPTKLDELIRVEMDLRASAQRAMELANEAEIPKKIRSVTHKTIAAQIDSADAIIDELKKMRANLEE